MEDQKPQQVSAPDPTSYKPMRKPKSKGFLALIKQLDDSKK